MVRILFLSPKKKGLEKVLDYKPISLCNILYKIVTRTIMNILKIVLPDLISNNHSAFVLGRLINDSVITAFELLHSSYQKNNGNKGFMAMKLDMSKTYDRVQWGFLTRVIGKLGFSSLG